jgi:Phage Tail Collar Domain
MKKLLLLLALSVGAASAVRAQIPQNIAYQGYLTQNGVPVNSTIPASFTLWDAQTGGNQVWNQQQSNVQVTNGYYTVMLNFEQQYWQGAWHDSSFNHQYWLEVLINGNTLGRVQLAASPYAMNARIADSAIHVPQAPVGTIEAFGGNIEQLRNNENKLGWYVCDGRLIPVDSIPDYATAVSNIYGVNNTGDSVFLPDLRGLFLRGVNRGFDGDRTDSLKDPDAAARVFANPNGTGNSGDQVGTIQRDALQSHFHYIGGRTSGGGAGSWNYQYTTTGGNGGGWFADPPNQPAPGGNYMGGTMNTGGSSETRPKNAYVYWIIKVR